MQIDYDVPFYANTDDGMHCYEANLRMILKFLFPDEEYSWEYIDEITEKVPGMYTWPMLALIWMQKKGIEIVDVELFDNQKFIEKGAEHLREEFGDEFADTQVKYSNIAKEQENTKEFLKYIKTEKRIPTIEDIEKYLKDGYILTIAVNARILDGLDGYASHSIIVKGINEDGLIIHDPGLPPNPNMKVNFDLFESAWAYPNEKAKGLTAFKLKK